MDDFISKEAALRAIRIEGINQAEQYGDRHHPVVMAYGHCFGLVQNINPEELRPKGQWIDGTCSVCKFDAMYIKNSTVQVLTGFCPNCGAKMYTE